MFRGGWKKGQFWPSPLVPPKRGGKHPVSKTGQAAASPCFALILIPLLFPPGCAPQPSRSSASAQVWGSFCCGTTSTGSVVPEFGSKRSGVWRETPLLVSMCLSSLEKGLIQEPGADPGEGTARAGSVWGSLDEIHDPGSPSAQAPAEEGQEGKNR